MTPQAATSLQPVKTSSVGTSDATQQNINHMQQLYDSIARRAFEIFDGNGRWFGNDLSNWLQAESEVLHPMHLEIAESDNAFAVTAEVPGFTAKEIDVEVDGNRLTISGKHETSEESTKGKTIYSERCAKEVFRSITLPVEVDSAKVNAVLKDGVLSIDLPKAAKNKTQRIETKTGS